jgi:hypothetical protein
VSPEDKTNTQLDNAVINDIRELVDQTKNSRSDCARTTLSVITASTSGLNVQKEHKTSLLIIFRNTLISRTMIYMVPTATGNYIFGPGCTDEVGF